MASPTTLLLILFLLLFSMVGVGASGSWCVARSASTPKALQLALDYACGSLADCDPISPNGLCYLPNTMLAHASYAFNSYYQKSSYAPGSCEFGGTATLTVTDPSYGSCTYPSSPSSAGATTAPPSPTSPPVTNITGTPTNMPNTANPIFGGGGGDMSGGFSPTTTDMSGAHLASVLPLLLSISCLIPLVI